MDNNINNLRKIYEINERQNRQDTLLNKNRMVVNDQQKEIINQYTYLNNVENNEVLKLKIYETENSTSNINLNNFENYKAKFFSNDILLIHEGIIQIRLLTTDENENILDVLFYKIIENQMIPKLIEFLKNYQQPHLQIESCWIITNLLSKESKFIKLLIDKDIINILIDLTLNGFIDLKEQSIYGLKNIISDNNDYIKILFNNNIFQSWIIIFQKNDLNSKIYKTSLNFLYVVSYKILFELDKGYVNNIYKYISVFIDIFKNLLLNFNDDNYYNYSITFLACFKYDQIACSNIMDKEILIKLLSIGRYINNKYFIQYIYLLTMFIDMQFEDIILSNNIFELIEIWINNFKEEKEFENIIRFIYLLIKNNNQDSLSTLFINNNILNKLMNNIMFGNNPIITSKIILIEIFNLFFNLITVTQINILLNSNYLEFFRKLLYEDNNSNILLSLLCGIDNLLTTNKKIVKLYNNDSIYQILIKNQIIKRVYELQKHHNYEVYKSCINIITVHIKNVN